MARVVFDVSVAGEGWFKDALKEMADCEKVLFVFTSEEKYIEELKAVPKLLSFLKEMNLLGRRIDADGSACAEHRQYLENLPEWAQETSCDDSHIFAIIYEKPSRFVFSKDTRLARCRSRINQVVNNRYCAFRCIGSNETYISKKNEIFS